MIRAKGANAAERRQLEDKKALLDLVLEDAHGLRRRLGRDDQYKLDEYLDSVRDLEKRLEFFSKPDPRVWKPSSELAEDMAAPKGAPGDHQEHVRLMLDLMVLAFRTDSTRISTFMFANDVSGKNFSGLIPGVKGGHHEFSHHQNKAEKYEPYSKINRWHNEQLAYFMDKLASIREGERTLLDNSMVLFGSSMSDGNRHDPSNLPIILAGKAGGRIKPGRHIASPEEDAAVQSLRVDAGEDGHAGGSVRRQHRGAGDRVEVPASRQTVETVVPSSCFAYTPLKWGVNETSRFNPNLLTAPFTPFTKR